MSSYAILCHLVSYYVHIHCVHKNMIKLNNLRCRPIYKLGDITIFIGYRSTTCWLRFSHVQPQLSASTSIDAVASSAWRLATATEQCCARARNCRCSGGLRLPLPRLRMVINGWWIANDELIVTNGLWWIVMVYSCWIIILIMYNYV